MQNKKNEGMCEWGNVRMCEWQTEYENMFGMLNIDLTQARRPNKCNLLMKSETYTRSSTPGTK